MTGAATVGLCRLLTRRPELARIYCLGVVTLRALIDNA